MILVLAVSLFVWSEMDWYPINVLTWHLQHGNTARLGEFNVPVSIWVRPDPNYQGLRFDLRHGKFAYVDVELGRKITPGDRWKEALEANSKSTDPRIAGMAKRLLAMKTTRVMIADQPSFCIEDVLTVHCFAESKEKGLTVDFLGLPELKPLFFQTLSRITRIHNS